MANAGVYRQGQLASRMFGTPGVNRSAGAAFGTLSQGAGQLLNDQMNTQQTRNFTVLHGINAIGSLLAQAASKAQASAGKQAGMLEDASIAQDAFDFKNFSNDTARQMQQDFIDRPQDASEPFRDKLQQRADDLIGKYSSSQRGTTKMVQELRGIQSSQYDQMGDWSMTRRTAQTQQMGRKTTEQTKQMLSQLDAAPLPKMLDQAEGIMRQQSSFLENLEPIIGSESVSLLNMQMRKDAGPAFFNSALNALPDDPADQLRAIPELKELAQNQNKVYMDSSDRRTLLGHIEATEGQAFTALQNKNMVDELTTTTDILARGIQLDRYRNNAPMQTQAIEYASQQSQGILAQIAQTKADPRLTDKAKIALTKLYNSQLSSVDGLVKRAHSNLQFVQTEQSKLAAEGRSAAREAKTQATAAMNQRKQETAAGLSDLRLQMRTAMAEDPIANQQKILKLGAAIVNYTRDAHASGLLSNEQALAGTTEALNTAKTAAEYRPKPGLFIGISTPFGKLGTQTDIGGGAPERLSGQKNAGDLMQRQQQFEQQMQQMATQMAHHDKQGQLNTQAGFTPAMQEAFDRRSAPIKQLNLSQTEINFRLDVLRNRIRGGN